MTSKQVGNILLIITAVVIVDCIRHYTWGKKQQPKPAFQPIGMTPYAFISRRA